MPDDVTAAAISRTAAFRAKEPRVLVVVLGLLAVAVAAVGLLFWLYFTGAQRVAALNDEVSGLHGQIAVVQSGQQDAAGKSQALFDQLKALGKTPVVPAAIPGPGGPAGTPGSPGIAGQAGAAGGVGPQGVPGQSPPCLSTAAQCVGATGAKGETGSQGVAGSPGSPGAAGATGPQGATGPAGPPGPNCSTGSHVETVTYASGQSGPACVANPAPAPGG